MLEGRGQGGQLPLQILADQKAPPGSGGAPHYYLPPQIFRLCNMPGLCSKLQLTNKVKNWPNRPLCKVGQRFAIWSLIKGLHLHLKSGRMMLAANW